MLAQTEIERVKFIVRSYMRTRLYKVRNGIIFPIHILTSKFELD